LPTAPINGGSAALSAEATDPWPWFSENGILETLQVLFLVVTMVRYLSLLRTADRVVRSIFAGGALIALGCILREVDFEPEGPLGSVDRILKGPVRIAVIVIAIPVLVIYIQTLRRHLWALPRLILGTWWGRTCIFGGLVIVLGTLFDRGLVSDSIPHRWEEILETIGFLLVGVSSFIPRITAERAIERPLWPPRTADVAPSV
jgi:hypothetical protein